MDFLPIFLDIRGKTVLVEGDDTVAARRVERALDAGAHVVLCSPDPKDELVPFLDHANLTHHARAVAQSDMDNVCIAYGATEIPERDATLHRFAQEARVLCNIADAPEFCDFITPSIVDRAPITVAISTSGAAPVIARVLRARIESMLPASFGRLAEFVGAYRQRIAETVPAGAPRRRFWERMIDGPAGDTFLNGDEEKARTLIEENLANTDHDHVLKQGEVYLVGAGPGDPDLLSFRALRLMQRADVVLYDRLLGHDIMALVRRDAKRIYVGKQAKNHTMDQQDISALLVKLAQDGKRVLRLKGGDPFIFGRGGEEIEMLAQHGIPFQVVPGITAAAGCGSYAGIPLTHRDHAQSVTFVTAHGREGVLEQNWAELVRQNQTVVVYMGLSSMSEWMGKLIANGTDQATPVAVVDNGTRANQRVVTGTVGDIITRVANANLTGPSVVIIGSVVTLRNKLSWFKRSGETHEMGIGAGF